MASRKLVVGKLIFILYGTIPKYITEIKLWNRERRR